MGTLDSLTAGLDESKILRVRSSSSAQKLAAAVAHAVYDEQRVVLRAIGAGAVNQAVKAITIATQYAALRGLILVLRTGFTSVQMPDKEDVSAMVFYVFTLDP